MKKKIDYVVMIIRNPAARNLLFNSHLLSGIQFDG